MSVCGCKLRAAWLSYSRTTSIHLKSVFRLLSSHQTTAANVCRHIKTKARAFITVKPFYEATAWRWWSGWWWRAGGGKSNRAYRVKLAAAAATSCFLTKEEENSEYVTITVHELENSIDDLKQYIHCYYGDKQPSAVGNWKDIYPSEPELREGWNLVSKTAHYAIYNRPMKDGVTQYKVRARYEDIPAAVFLFVQMDIEGRRYWDQSTDVVELVDQTRSYPSSSAASADLLPQWNGSLSTSNIPPPNENYSSSFTTISADTIYWRVNFPRPLAKRDYVFARSCILDRDRNVLVLMNKAVAHSSHPPSREYVRVTSYNSQMIIRPHQSFTQNGLDYVLTYHDDTKVNMPSYACKRIIQTNLPVFMESVHKEARALYQDYMSAVSSGCDLESTGPERLKVLHQLIQHITSSVRETPSSPLQTPSPPCPTTTVGDEVKTGHIVTEEENSIHSKDDNQPRTTEEVPDEDALHHHHKRSWQKFIPIRKIQPPRYLPDIEMFATRLLREGRLSGLQLKCYHTSGRTTEAHSYPTYSKDRSQENHDEDRAASKGSLINNNYPNYDD